MKKKQKNADTMWIWQTSCQQEVGDCLIEVGLTDKGNNFNKLLFSVKVTVSPEIELS